MIVLRCIKQSNFEIWWSTGSFRIFVKNTENQSADCVMSEQSDMSSDPQRLKINRYVKLYVELNIFLKSNF